MRGNQNIIWLIDRTLESSTIASLENTTAKIEPYKKIPIKTEPLAKFSIFDSIECKVFRHQTDDAFVGTDPHTFPAASFAFGGIHRHTRNTTRGWARQSLIKRTNRLTDPPGVQQ